MCTVVVAGIGMLTQARAVWDITIEDIVGGINANANGTVVKQRKATTVALMWMVQQAEAASVKFTYIDEQFKQVTRPVVHDQCNNGGAWVPTNPGGVDFGYRYDRTFTYTNGEAGETTETFTPAADREVRFPARAPTTTENAFGTKAAELEGMINRSPNWQHRTEEFGYADNCVGAVDMSKYREWLQNNYNLKILPAVNEGSSVICQPG